MTGRSLFLFLLCLTTNPIANANLVITEVVDGTVFSVGPRYVEVTNLGATSIDLNEFSISVFNGSSASGTTMGLSGTLNVNDSYVISFEFSDSPGSSVFFSTYGFDPDHFDFKGIMDGGDTIALYKNDASNTLIDIYGVVGLSAKFQAWNFLDGYSFRNSSVDAANPNFTVSEWTFGGEDSLDGADNAAREQTILANTTPGTFAIATVPEPSALLFGSLVCILLGMKHVRKADRG